MRTRSPRGTVAPMALALLVLFLGVSVEEAFGQTPYVPYFGKNRIRYNDFKWNIYKTDHFEIYYYPEIEKQLERVTSYAESAYQQVSSDLKHDLAFKVPLVLYKTESEFQQQNIEPGELPEGVLAFAEPYRDRMVLPIDEPSDALYRLITHELTHIFEFDIIPRSLLHRQLPLWVDEGLSDYMTGYWQPFDLMTVRDAAIADIIPSMSDFEGVAFVDGRLPYNLGHAAFEFIESRWGKEGLAPVPLRAAQGGDRRRRERLRRSVPAEARRVRRAVRQVPEGSLQAVPRQGTSAGLRQGSRAETWQDAVHRRGVDRAVALGRSDGGRRRQPQGSGTRHRADVDQGRQDRPQPDQRLQQESRLRVHRHAGRLPQQRRLVDVVVAGRRSDRLLCPHRKEQDADPSERRHQEDRKANRAQDGR